LEELSLPNLIQLSSLLSGLLYAACLLHAGNVSPLYSK